MMTYHSVIAGRRLGEMYFPEEIHAEVSSLGFQNRIIRPSRFDLLDLFFLSFSL